MISEEIIKQRIKKVLIDTLELGLTADEIDGDAHLDQLFGFDSVVAIEFILGLEKEFDMKIEPEFLELETLSDLNKLSLYLSQRIARSEAR
jgi:acyl carrier protein